MEYLKKEIRTFQNGKTVNDQFYIDDDYNVPDAKKDVGRIIISDGTLQVEEMKQVENYLKVTGKLEFRVLYTADETIPEPASLEGRIPFEEMIYLEQEPDGNLVLKTADVDLTVTVIHSRKLNIKTLAEITIGMEKCVGEELTTDIEGENPVFKKTKEEEARSLASVMAKEAHKDFWDGYERSTQNQIVRKYYRAIIAEDKKRRMDMFLNCLKQSYDKVSGWSKEKIATVKAGLADAEACCAEVGTSVAGVCGRVSRRMKTYNNTAPDKKAGFNEVRDMYAEFAGEMAKAVGSVSEDIYTYVKAEQFKEKIENMDISIQSLPNISITVDNDKELDGESVFKDIPLEELSFYNDTCLYPSSQYSSL